MPGFRLLLDQGIPRDTAALLREVGFECVHVGEIGMSRSEDREILILASEQRATVVTLDADFHALLAVTSAAGTICNPHRNPGLKCRCGRDSFRR